ncbi:MAG: hypothetical protein ACLPUT_04575, partial [Solirubrobacteraceae bacterium]
FSAGGHVYVREGETTLEIPGSAGFLAASADGSRVLLNDGELYNVGDLGEAPVDLTGGHGGFQGVLARTEDLSSIYFTDTAELTPEANKDGEKAQAGDPNVYRYHEGTLTFIVTTPASYGQTSPDGRYLAFMSLEPLTGYDNQVENARSEEGFCPGQGEILSRYHVPIRACYEVFEYDATSANLACASCNPAGIPPLGLSVLPTSSGLAQPHNLSDNGRVFFDSRDTLTPADVNGSIEDVYEYEPAGTGSCTPATSDASGGGCIFLISAGHGSSDSNFLAASEEGKDAFFTTRDDLLPADKSELMALYDAREAGGFPEPPEPQPCTSEECKPPAAPRPALSTPASNAFQTTSSLTTPIPTRSPTPAPLTPAQKLAKALKHCHKQKNKKKRATCETHAHKTYPTTSKTSKHAQASHHHRRTTPHPATTASPAGLSR